jgi:hypothetical protein
MLHYTLPPSFTGKTNHHPGNIKWRLIIEERKDEYNMSFIGSRKQIIAMEVVRIWRGLSPPGRFLGKDEETGLWSDIGDEDARNKCSQTLREQMGKKRKNPNDDVTASSSAAPSLLSSTSVPTYIAATASTSVPTYSTVMTPPVAADTLAAPTQQLPQQQQVLTLVIGQQRNIVCFYGPSSRLYVKRPTSYREPSQKNKLRKGCKIRVLGRNDWL